MIEIYEALLASASLSKRHEDELIEKRGLSLETIRRFRFGSGGLALLEGEGRLAKAFREEDLVQSGVFVHDGKRARLNPMLLSEEIQVEGKRISNILIPYLDEVGKAYFVRPHKLGFRGIPSEIYQKLNLAGNPAEIVLTEGEFKAAAGMQYGVQTIAVPGISSFSEAKFPELMKLLADARVRRVVILFDNETKDDPAIPERYKEDPSKRHDTEFYAYYMASRLEREGKEAVIAQLPDSWKERGKIDLDGAAAQGRTAGEIRKILYDAKLKNDYLHDLPKEAREAVLRKSAQKRHRSSVRREFNRYVVTRRRGKTEWEDTISNFVIRIVATHDTIEGVQRAVEFVNEFGRRSSSFTMSPEAMAGADGFRVFCLSRGDFVWRGTLEDLMTIWESEFLMMDESRYIVESDHVGWVDSEGIWLFGNVAIDREGREIRPDKNGVFWLEKRGVKPVALSVTTGKSSIAEGIPTLHAKEACHEEIRRRLAESIGKNEAAVILGWATAVLFMEEVFRAWGSFPFLFLTGRSQSGKSTVADWVMNLFGVENAGRAMSQTTPVAIQRALSYYSSLPVFLDEFRNTREIAQKAGFLRNVYNRQSAGKGIKADFGLREGKIRGTLLVTGEETPKDWALLTRCITVFISKQKRTENHFAWFMAHRPEFSAVTLSILKRKPVLLPAFGKAFGEWKDHFVKEGIDDRTAINYATVVAGYAAAFGEGDLGFASWLAEETRQVQAEQGEEQAVNVFLDDLLALKTRGLIDKKYWDVRNGRIYLYFHGLHQVWSEQHRKSRGEEAFKEGSIRAYLKEEPGFEAVNVPWRIEGQLKKCVVFRVEEASAEIRNLVEEEVAV